LKLHAIEMRSRALRSARAFFHERGYTEVETPVRIPAPALETHIDAPRSEGAWLRTSPELHMKRLLAQGCDRIFQLGPCFRRGECGARHNPEFTMLEWYRRGCGYLEILDETGELLRRVARDTTGSTDLVYRAEHIALDEPWTVLSVAQAFEQFAGWNPAAAWDEERFERDLLERVEPALPRGRPCVLKDYPARAAALARLSPQNPLTAERWELYLGGLEIANAYGELCDARQQRERFEACAAERAALGREVYPLDEPFLQALERGLPPCAGIALGFDRLMMLLCDAAEIGEVRLFAQKPGELY
jgi:elongation factor P--(R)-beta-lysine ligase